MERTTGKVPSGTGRGGRSRQRRQRTRRRGNEARRRTEDARRFAAVRRALRAALWKRAAALELDVDVREEEHRRYRYWLLTDDAMPGELAFEARRELVRRFCAAHS